MKICKAAKRSIGGYLILCLLVSLSATLQVAASAAHSDAQESYDYTLAHHADQVSPIQEETYLDIADMPQDLAKILNTIPTPTEEPDVHLPQLLAVVAEDVQNKQYYKYLFASNGLLPSNQAQQKAHNLNYHLVKAPEGPVLWQVLSFLNQRSSLEIKTLMLPKDTPLCLPCGHMCMHLFGKKMSVHKAGCQGQPFPTTAGPTSAIACFYSDRFTDQQRRLVISQVGDKAFPDPKKRITSPLFHDPHKPSSTDHIASYHSEDDQAASLPPDQLLIPANGQCLYTTVIMGYLLPVRQVPDEVNARIDQLFGLQPAYYLNELHQTLENPTDYLTYLHSDAFSTLVTAFMARMRIKKGTWGGPEDIQTIANKLTINIQEYYPDPSNPTNLIQSDLTSPAQANATITIHIVRDKVHPTEVLSQIEKASAQDNPHYQHYRLKYTLPPSILVPLLPNTQPSIPHQMGSQQESQPYIEKWFKAAETGNRKWLRSLCQNYNINVNTKNEHKYTALMKSARNGHLDCVKYLVQQGANINEKNVNKATALILSALNGHLDCLTFLLQQDAHLHESNDDDYTALLLSAKNGHLDCLTFLLQQGADLHHENVHGETAWLLSVQQGHLACLKYLLQQGADLHDENENNDTALLFSAQNGHLTCLKYLIEHGADIHHKNKSGTTSLILSAANGHLDCLKFLHQQGADVRDKNEDNGTALLFSAQNGYLACLKFLVEQEANIHHKGKWQNTALLGSAANGHLDCIKYLLQQGANIHHKDKWQNTALLRSAANGHLDCVKYLVEQGANIHDKNKNGDTVLIWSAANEHLDCLKYLKKKGADIRDKNEDNETALLLSASNGHLICLKYLIEHGADIHHKNKSGTTSLIWSAANGHLDCLKFLLQQGTHIRDKNVNNETALLFSAQNGHLACLKYLIEHGADLHHKNKWQNTALLRSSSNGHLDCVKFLLQKGANIHDKNVDNDTALILSAHNGHLDCLKYLLQQDADLHHKNEQKNTALMFSAYNGHLACVKCLLQKGAHIHDKNVNNETVLLFSAQNGHLACLKYLIEHGADLHHKNKWQNTALLRSSSNGHLDCVKFLLQKGANIHDKNVDNDTALILSAHNGHLDCLKYLLQQDADLHHKNEQKNTALMFSAYNGHLACVKCLLQKGAHIHDKNVDKNTALLFSAQNGHLDCLKYLVEHGADVHGKNNGGYTALISSASNGHLDCLKYLVQQGANIHDKTENNDIALLLSVLNGHVYLVEHGAHVHHKNKYGDTALICSASNGHLACVKYLVEKGADITVKGSQDKTALQWAEAKSKQEVANFLLKEKALQEWFEAAKAGNIKWLRSLYNNHNINVSNKNANKDTALLLSANNGHLDCLKFLLQKGADVHEKNEQKNTALILSAYNGDLACLKFLYQEGAHIRDKNVDNETALHLSAQNEHIDCLKYLVQQGANIHEKNVNKDTALTLSAYNGHLDCLKYLLQQGADIHDKNHHNNTALIFSAYKGYLDCVKSLHQQGANIDDKNVKKDTALLFSARNGHVDCVKYLIQQGADITWKGEENKTALEWAIERGKKEVVNFLSTLVKREKHRSDIIPPDQLFIPVNRQPSVAPMDTTIHPLKSLLEDTPHQIAWQGWVAMAAYGDTLQETYAMVTIEGLLYTLKDRPTLHTKSHIAIDRTIHLADYGFVLNIDVHKPNSFVLAKVNPNNTHTLTAGNAFTLDTPTTDTLENELISYVAKNNVSTTQLNRFLDWLVAEEMDEEALIEDIIDKLPATQSNTYQQFPTLYKLISEWLPKLHKEKIHAKTLVGHPDQQGTPQASPLLYALRTIPHAYFYIDAQDNAIYALRRDTTLVADKDKAKQEKEAKESPTAPSRRQRDRDLDAPRRRMRRSSRGWGRHTASTTKPGITIDTTHYHLVPFLYQIKGDDTTIITYYCLVPPSYTITYQNLVKLLINHQRMPVEQLTYMHSDKALQDKKETINWHITKRKAFQVYFGLAPYFLQTPERILWQGWTYLGKYREADQQSYCLITDDDKLYTFRERPDFERPFHAKIQHTIDLAHYSFVHSDPDHPNRLILSQVNPALQQPTAQNTLTFYTAEAELPPTTTIKDKDNTTPPSDNDTLQDSLISYLYRQGVDETTLQRFCDFCVTASLDEEALIADIATRQRSNIQKRFPAIFDQLARFVTQPDFQHPADVRVQHTIDLANDSFVHSDSVDPNKYIFSQVNPALPQSTENQADTPPLSDNDTLQDSLITYLCTQDVEEATVQRFWDFCVTEALDEEALIADVTTPQQSNIHKAFPAIFDQLVHFVAQQKHLLLHTLRRATHQYHYMQPIDKQPNLCAFDQAAPLDTSAYRLVQISCQTKKYHTATNLYCLLPCDYQPTYQAFAQLWQAYFNTKSLQLTTLHDENTTLEANQTHIHWDTKVNKAFTIILPAIRSKDALCHLEKKQPPDNPTAKSKAPQQSPVKKPSKRKKKRSDTPQQVADLFAYEAKFGKMNRLDLWALDPLQQLQDPRILLKKLLVEVIENGYWPDLGRGCYLSNIKTVKYVTPEECRWLAKIQAIVDCDRHCKLGKPLNIAEMAAIKLYTDSIYSYPDLCLSQRTGHLDKWIVWDQLLMTALLKLHLAELHHNQKCRYSTYSGLVNIEFKVKERIGFFKTYVSTSKRISKALEFTADYGMLMYITPEMQQQFINGDVSWISKYPEGEILFARSADITGFPAPKWKAKVQNYLVYDPKQYGCVLKDVQEVQRYGLMGIQQVNFSPAAAPLIIAKGTTYTLPAQAASHEFSYIKIEEDATLTIVPWQTNQPSGGHLTIRCYGDCMLGKNAKITVSAKGYSGSTSPLYDGHGPRGGASGTYCAAGGSNSTAGGSGQCRDAFAQATTYHASSTAAYGQVILTKDTLSCGSGGGYIAYPDNSDTGLSPGAYGAPGGGTLYLEIDGQLQLAENSAFLANGGEATPLTGGAGSGGSICLALKGEITFTNDKAKFRVNAQGGDNQKAIRPRAQGAGGAGHITLYINQYNQEALKRFVTQPPALVLHRTQVVQRKNYKNILVDDYLIEQGIPFAAVKHFWQWLEREEMEEDAIMDDMETSTPSQSNIYLFDKSIFDALRDFMATLAPQQLSNTSTATPVVSTAIPDHVTMVGKYYNAQGEDHAEKADYLKAALYHKATLALQTKKYGNQQPHPDKADTLLYCAKVAAYQGNYSEAIKHGSAALDMREKLYQADTPAHTAIIEARNQLGWLDFQQGHHTQALQRLEATLQLWKDHHRDQQDLLLVDTYNYIGLIKQSLGQYQQAIDHYHKKAENMAQSASAVNDSLQATTLHYMGQAQTQMGQYSQAIATHHAEMTLLEALHGKDTPHSDKARSLRGEALAYLKQGNFDVAMQQYRTALAQLKKIYEEKAKHSDKKTAHPDIAAAFSGIAHAHAAQGHYHLATLFHQKSQTMHQDIYGKEARHPAIADNLDDLGDLALQQQKTDKAKERYQRAYEMKIELYGSQEAHLAIALSHANIGRALLQANQLEKALTAQKKALEMASSIYGEAADIPIIGRLQREIGLVHQAMQDYDKAQAAYRISLTTYKLLFGDQPHPDTADTLSACGKAHLGQKAYVQALQDTLKALKMRQTIYQKVPHHPTISTALLQLGDVYAAQNQHYTAIHYYAQATRCQITHLGTISDLGQNLARVVPTNASQKKRLANGEQPLPLHENSMVPFLREAPSQVLLLHGEAGAGKSLYGRFLEKSLWDQCPKTIEAMQIETYTIPLFINLPALQYPAQNAILQALQQYGWDKNTIAYFKAQLRKKAIIAKEEEKEVEAQLYEAKEKAQPLGINASFVIILDGYDEINHLTKPLNLYAAHQLHTWQAKIVVTCRTEHLESISDHAHYFAPDGKGLTERYIRPFDAQQIDHYLDKIAQEARTANHWTKEDYHNALAKIPSLQELIKSPFLLRIITTILPQLQSENHSDITRTAVYTAFIDQWIQKELTRMQITGTAAQQKAAAAKAYAAALGFELFFQEKQIVHTNSPDKAWQRFFADAQALTYLALLPLRKVGAHQYQFLHKSCQEFFAAQHIYNSLVQLHEVQKDLLTYFSQQVKPYQFSDRGRATKDIQTYHHYTISCPPINQKLLKTEPAIIAFLRDGLVCKQATTFQQWLFQIIKASTRNPKVATSASNAITLLAAGAIPLGGNKWPHIQIPDAVLDRAFLAHTNLQGANLKGVSLREAHLEGAQCQHAQVAGIQFGEYPYFIHDSGVISVSWSHDDRFLASASSDNTVRVWDRQTGQQVQICQGHDNYVMSVSWSHDDRFLASASYDDTVRVWDATTGEQVQICLGHTSLVNSVRWSHDDRFLASASWDNTVCVWDPKTGEQVQICLGHDNYVNSVSWSHDDRFLASASYDNTVRVWAPKTGGQVQICQGHTSWVQSVSWSHDDRFLASASDDNTVRVWGPKTGQQVQICQGHTGTVNSVSWSHDDRFLASASWDNTVCVWDPKTGQQGRIYQGHTGWVESVNWSHDDQFLASASWDNTVRIWDRQMGPQVKQIDQRHSFRVSSVRWSHDDRFLASASGDYYEDSASHTVRVWDAKTGTQVQICLGHDYAVNSVRWSHDDRFLASASSDKSVRVWDPKTGGQVQICQGHDSAVLSVNWSHDDRFLASASDDDTVRIWAPKTGQQVQICLGHTSWVHSVSWSHGDRFLASASSDHTVRIWDPKTGQWVQICLGHTDSVNSVSWSHDDRFLASASEDNSVRVWALKTGEQVQICLGHKDEVNSVSWSHDDRFLASASDDKTVRVWDPKTGQQVQICLGHDKSVTSVSWSHDDRFLASASYDKTVRVWDRLIMSNDESSFITGTCAEQREVSPAESKDKSKPILPKECRPLLVIGKWNGLVLKDADFSGAIGLSDINKQLIHQRNEIVILEWFEAAETGNRKLLAELYHKYINFRDGYNNTALILSASNGHLDCLKYLVTHGADIHAKEENGYTALHLSSSESHLDCLKYLIQQGADIHAKAKDGWTVLHFSALKGHLDCFKYLVEHGTDIHQKDNNGWTALHLNALNGHTGNVKYLVEQGANIHDKDKNKNTALILSAQKGHLDCIKYLHGQGADIHAINDNGDTALLLSVQAGHLDCIKYLIDAKDNAGNTALLWNAQYGHLYFLMWLLEQGADIHAKEENGYTALHLSSSESHLDCLKYLIQRGADIHAKAKNGWTALHLSASNGRLDCIKWLLEQGANIHAKAKNGWTVLHFSALKGHLDCFKYLVEHGTDIHQKDNNGWTALHLNALNGHTGNVKYLVEQGANIHDKDKNRNTALILSAQKGHLDCIKYLHEQGADIHAKGQAGHTALHVSALNGHTENVKYLLEQGANVHAKEKYGWTALHLSAANGRLDCVKWLLEQGTEINTKDNWKRTALHLSAEYGHLDCVKWLLEQGTEINTKDNWKRTALHLSAEYGHLACLKYLLEQGADINAKAKDGWTVLHLSAHNGHLACLKYLVEQGADLHDKNAYENTALILSARNGHLDCVKHLVSQGADLHAKANNGWTALHLSAANGRLDCVKWLLQQGADIHAKNEKGNTSLILSALKGHLACVKFLLQQGADIHDKNAYENTALILSALKGHLDCVQYLVEQGADVTFKGGYRYKTALGWAKEKGHQDVVEYLSNFTDKD